MYFLGECEKIYAKQGFESVNPDPGKNLIPDQVKNYKHRRRE